MDRNAGELSLGEGDLELSSMRTFFSSTDRLNITLSSEISIDSTHEAPSDDAAVEETDLVSSLCDSDVEYPSVEATCFC